MLSLDEYARHDGLGLAELVRRREVTPRELVDTALTATRKLNPKINAVLQLLEKESAGEIEAGLPDGPFRGVPFALKELVIHAKGVRLDMGSRLAQGLTFPHDSELMARFRRAGLVTVGTTQTPEFGYNPTTETVLHGPVRNPWNPAHSAGGSSGGSGAAVAAGIFPLAHANDGGGSIRIPASCNGLVGLKPTRDRIPTGPDASDPLLGLTIEFAVTKSVRDAAALLDAVAGPDVGAPGFIAPPERPFAQALHARPRRLRIAFTTHTPFGARVDPACEAAVQRTAKLLADLGHELVEAAPAYDWAAFVDSQHVIWTAGTAWWIYGMSRLLGREPSAENLEAVTLDCWEAGRRWTALELLAAQQHCNDVSRSVGAFFVEHELLLTPTLARPPVRLGEIDQNRSGLGARAWLESLLPYLPFTPLFNVTGQPAISLPLHWTDGGLPIGVQLAGRMGAEATLLGVAAQLEEAAPWAGRRPPIHVAA
jgi:amidase